MKKTKSEKGITLIALIITIVVLLVIAVVTIGIIKERGIIRYAQDAESEYTAQKGEEENIISGYESIIEGTLNGEENIEKGPTSITISGPDTAKVGEKMEFIAYDQDDNILYGDDVSWFGSGVTIELNSYIACVTSTAPITTTIRVTSKSNPSICAVKNIEIIPAGPTSITISSAPSTMETGKMEFFVAYDQNGKILSSNTVSWYCGNSAVKISEASSGVYITSNVAGTIPIKVTLKSNPSIYAVAYITVSQAGPTSIRIVRASSTSFETGKMEFFIAYDQDGKILSSNDVSWYCGNSAIKISEASSGAWITSNIAGSIPIKVTSKSNPSIYTVTTISVSQAGPTSIRISGPSAIQKGVKTYLIAYDQNNNALYEDKIYWNVPSGVTIENTSGGVYITSTITGTIYIRAISRSNSSVYGGIYIPVSN